MSYIMFGIIALGIFSAIVYFTKKEIDMLVVGLCALIIAISYGGIVGIDYKMQTEDHEIWSGKITEVEHIEEWDEWIPPKTEEYTETTSDGKTVTKTRVIPGYWEHHDAENYITTTDKGRESVYKTLDGKEFTDDFVNSNKELEKYYPIGKPTASVHTYENKLKASYSIFRHKDIDLKDFENMPDYPVKENDNLTVDRLIGDFKNKDKVNEHLDEVNTRLNDTNNPNNKDKVKSYKQVNLMFVNFGDKTEDYGYALQDHWRNGAKNDVVITFGTDSNNKPTWCYVFSWTDVEILKIDIREYIMSQGNLNNFEKVIDDVSVMIEKKFDRKQFKDFDYIQIETRTVSKVFMVVILIGCCAAVLLIDRRY